MRQKLNPIGLEFEGKNVLLVDDSIVRGTTSAQIIQMARDAGAKKVYFASAAPPVRYQNVYGIDMPVTSELVAHKRSVPEVADRIRADRLVYQDLPDLVSAVRKGNPRIGRFETSIFTGEYVTGAVTKGYPRGARRPSQRPRKGRAPPGIGGDNGGPQRGVSEGIGYAAREQRRETRLPVAMVSM